MRLYTTLSPAEHPAAHRRAQAARKLAGGAPARGRGRPRRSHVQKFAERWTNEELHPIYPDDVHSEALDAMAPDAMAPDAIDRSVRERLG